MSDTPKTELEQAFAEFYRLDREEAAAYQRALDLGEQRADAAARVRELGGKL